ncbi:hypothetical protein APR04_002680 [Promicromonospora umidemergens]|uniref:Pyrroloquinoline-quinone binding quinoprotein n=1 Tax=Promicromonospora umidemergens TaxID=629679 RepID=A0ABP8WIP4_9MICO|nr:hypothetical protein [Promicromonospora umidemergens]MCP2283767.1 hypothetical protein [Promicromonospora umidemergens]
MISAPVPEWPRIEAVARPDGTGELTIDGTSHPIQALTVEEARLTILTRIADTAAELQRPVRALASGPDGQWPLIVHPDGRVQADESRPASPAPVAPSPSVFAPKLASTDEAAAPEPPVTGAADPAVEKPDGDPWAHAARQAQATAISTEPRGVTDSAPSSQQSFVGPPEEVTVVRAHGEVVDAAPFVGLPEEVTVVRAHGEVVDAAPFVGPPDDVTVVRAHGEVVDAAPFVGPPDDVTVVRAHGEAVDTAPAPAPAQPAVPRRRRIIRLTVAVAGAVVLVAAGTFAVVALTGNLPEPGPTTSVDALPGEGATLPVEAPAGYGQTALWSVPVGSEPQVLLTPDGGVLVAPVGDDEITILDRATGTATWEGRDLVEDLHLSQVGEGPVLAADSPGTLHVWPLDAPDPAGVAPTTIELGSDQAEVTYDGTAPLIVLPDQTVALLDKKGATAVSRDVPDGATPVAATPEHVIAVGPDAWWIITADADPVRHRLPKPEQAVGDPTAAIAVGGNQLAVVWRTEDSAEDVLALVGLNRNAIRTSSLIQSSAFRPDVVPLRDRAGSTRTIGPVLLDVGSKPVIADLGDIAPEAVLGRTVYGTSKSKPAVATWGPDGVNLEAAEGPGETAPIAALTKDVAFIVTSKADETFLYALPRIEGKNP